MQDILHVYILCVIVCRCVSGERPIDKPLQALVSFQKRQTRIALVPTDSFQGESLKVQHIAGLYMCDEPCRIRQKLGALFGKLKYK